MLQKMRKNVKGFTLIELMIVIAIIGILAAIAIPQFVKYRARSFNTQSLGDVRVVSNEVGGYYGEWTEYPLDTVSPVETNGQGLTILNTAGTGPNMEAIAVSANSVMSYTGATDAGGYSGGASDGKQFAVFSGSAAAIQEIALVFAHRDTDGTTAGDLPSNENYQFWPDELITTGTAEMQPNTDISGWAVRGN